MTGQLDPDLDNALFVFENTPTGDAVGVIGVGRGLVWECQNLRTKVKQLEAENLKLVEQAGEMAEMLERNKE